MDIIKKPFLSFLLGFGIAVIYIPGIIGGSISTGWFLLILIAPFCFELPSLFLVYALASLFWTTNFNIGLFYFLQLVALMSIYNLGQNLKDIRPIFKGLALGLGVSSVVALSQYYHYTLIYSLNGSPAGLFVNPNIYSEISVVILISLLLLKLFWWIPVTIPGIVFVHSRTALLALAFGLFVVCFRKDKRLAILSFVLIGLLSTVFYWNSFSISSIQERLDLWADTARGLSFFGNGVGSFEILYPNYAVKVDTAFARPKYAHNDLLQLVFEYGIGSILLIPIAWKVWTSDSEYKIILYVIGAISIFTYPFHVPMVAFIGCLIAGVVSSHNGAVCNSWDYRGSFLFKSIENIRCNVFQICKRAFPL